MGKHGKITWELIFKDFKEQHPKMKHNAIDYEPYGFATILVRFPNNVRKEYNYDTKQVRTLSRDEVEAWEARKLKELRRYFYI